MARKSTKKIPKRKETTEQPKSKKTAPFSPPAVITKKDVSPIEAEFPIVGMGASAGGLEAFEQFFSNMPADCGMAFVLVSHLAPTHKSLMPDLLKKSTKMQVYQVEDGMKVKPNTIYVIPPNKDIVLNKGTLLLMEPFIARGIRHPIDVFFRSLAEDHQEKAICIVLSGTGTEGTLGLQAVKAEGGFVMVQAPETAIYDGMPRSAVATGQADLILPPEKMPNELLKYAHRSLRMAKIRPEEIPGLPPDHLNKIFVLIRERTGHDFSDYKQSTINRRVEKRMFIHGIEKIQDYVRFLQQNPDEVRALFKELLISVTKFFRDPDAFESIKKEIIPELLANKPQNLPVRVWVVGCSTGEEAYSIAMLFKEYTDENLKSYDVQIFATDIDTSAVDKARAGVFPESIDVDVSPERLKRFFLKEKNTYKIRKEIREMIVFSIQNVIKDPPFSKLDMISCRNLLIYMNPKLQKKVLPVFHYALNKDGYMFLGNSETVGELADLFSIVDRQWKIYWRKGESGVFHSGFELALPSLEQAYSQAVKGEPKGFAGKMPELVKKMLLDLYTPPCVIVNDKMEIRYFHGKTGKYLEPAPGEARFNMIEMAREGLKPQLFRAVSEAQKQKKDIVFKDIHVKSDGELQTINLIVKLIREPETMRGWMIVIFDEIPPAPVEVKKKCGTLRSGEARKRITEMEQELKNTKESLQITIEELETSNEEMKSTNEELQSSNEELQSTNEELATVNSEFQNKIQELSDANSDMNNLLASLSIATVFLDNNLRIKRFTPAAADLINLIPGDIGRPFTDMTTNLIYDDMIADVSNVMQTLSPREKDVKDKNGNWYLTRILPYRTVENVIDGAVLTFVDITEVARLKNARLYAEGIVNTVREPLLILDENFHVVTANRSFYKSFQADREETEGRLVFELGHGQWDIPALRELLEKILPDNTTFENFQVDHKFPSIGHRKMLLNARRIVQADGQQPLILLAIEDVTENG